MAIGNRRGQGRDQGRGQDKPSEAAAAPRRSRVAADARDEPAAAVEATAAATAAATSDKAGRSMALPLALVLLLVAGSVSFAMYETLGPHFALAQALGMGIGALLIGIVAGVLFARYRPALYAYAPSVGLGAYSYFVGASSFLPGHTWGLLSAVLATLYLRWLLRGRTG